MYLLNSGNIKCFDKNYKYVKTYQKGGFFGEYNILFGLYSNMYYQPEVQQDSSETSGKSKKYVELLKIDKNLFVSEICKDLGTFNHFFNISL